MRRKHTSYRKLSIADQIASGQVSYLASIDALRKLVRMGMAASTIKRVKRAITKQFPNEPIAEL
jgi:hypothetical protein